MQVNINGKQLIKILFSSCLIVAISSMKSVFSDKLVALGPLFYFFLFLIVAFCLTVFELFVDWLANSNTFKRLFLKDSYICGWWLNYANRDKEKMIQNFSIIHIGKFGEKLYVDGMTCKIRKDGSGIIFIEPSSFKSRIAQYHPRDRSLGFHFTIT